MAPLTFETPTDVPRGATMMLGNFDGVHVGHRALVSQARALGRPVAALTFEPHPRTILHPHSALYRLTDADEKRSALLAAGVDAVVALRFDLVAATLAAEDFVRDVLVRRFGVRHVVVGCDYRFGRGRVGDLCLLQRMGDMHGFDVVAIPPVTDGLGVRYSSSLIRTLLTEGRVEESARLLGRAWSVSVSAEVEDATCLRAKLGRYVRLPAGRYGVRMLRTGQPEKRGIVLLEPGADRLILAGEKQPGRLVIAFDSRLVDEALPRHRAMRSQAHCA
jgi:riboflavin kinase/FMN adenylyltransferase